MLKDLVMIKKPECLTCKHLCSLNKKKYDCTEDTNCPAKTYKIILGVDINACVERMASALASNNIDELNVITGELANVDPEVKTKILNLAKAKSKLGDTNG